eukprot:364612-Chlamydomonas_euryale.AAC.12
MPCRRHTHFPGEGVLSYVAGDGMGVTANHFSTWQPLEKGGKLRQTHGAAHPFRSLAALWTPPGKYSQSTAPAKVPRLHRQPPPPLPFSCRSRFGRECLTRFPPTPPTLFKPPTTPVASEGLSVSPPHPTTPTLPRTQSRDATATHRILQQG